MRLFFLKYFRIPPEKISFYKNKRRKYYSHGMIIFNKRIFDPEYNKQGVDWNKQKGCAGGPIGIKQKIYFSVLLQSSQSFKKWKLTPHFTIHHYIKNEPTCH